MQATPSAERLHIAFFGLRNAGKSSLVNAVTGQELSLVSPVKGTTTDPVKKSMELLPLGPVVIIDTPGIDDEGELGEKRADRARRTLDSADIAVLVTDATATKLSEGERELLELFGEKSIPFVVAFNKSDLKESVPPCKKNEIFVSAKTGFGVRELKELIAAVAPSKEEEQKLIADLVCEGDLVLLVTPIDSAAPKGRLILPQQQVLRELLDCGASVVVTKETGLVKALDSLKALPRMVITDSQAFGFVSSVLPPEVPLTSFSILFARYKGKLEQFVRGAAALSALKDGDRVLICEGCTHHRQCGDIGTQKLPRLLSARSKCSLEFDFTSGGDFPQRLSDYSLVVHCGGCMLSRREVQSRLDRAAAQGVPVTNFGVALSKMNGIEDPLKFFRQLEK